PVRRRRRTLQIRSQTQRIPWPVDCIAPVLTSDCAVQYSGPDRNLLSNPQSDAPLKILVIDENPIRRAILEAGLRDGGFDNITLLGDTTGLVDPISSVDPDVII